MIENFFRVHFKLSLPCVVDNFHKVDFCYFKATGVFLRGLDYGHY